MTTDETTHIGPRGTKINLSLHERGRNQPQTHSVPSPLDPTAEIGWVHSRSSYVLGGPTWGWYCALCEDEMPHSEWTRQEAVSSLLTFHWGECHSPLTVAYRQWRMPLDHAVAVATVAGADPDVAQSVLDACIDDPEIVEPVVADYKTDYTQGIVETIDCDGEQVECIPRGVYLHILRNATPPANPVGAVEIARMLKVERQTVDAWRHRDILPDPDWTVGGRPAWDERTIVGWARRTDRWPWT